MNGDFANWNNTNDIVSNGLETDFLKTTILEISHNNLCKLRRKRTLG